MRDQRISRRLLKESTIEFRLEFTSSSEITTDDPGFEVARWSLTGLVDVLSGELTPPEDGAKVRPLRKDDDAPGWSAPILSVHGMSLPLGDRNVDLAEVLEDESADTAQCIVLLEDNDLAPEVSAFSDFGIGSELVFIDDAYLDPGWRGHGIGRLLIGIGLRRHLAGARCIATLPCPTELLEEYGERRDHPTFQAGLASVRRTWESLGFAPFTEELWLKDPSMVTGDTHVDELRVSLLGR